MRTWSTRESALVTLIAAHSLVIGFGMLFLPGLVLRLGGWPDPGSWFFVGQGGAFHLAVGVIYLAEYRRHRSVVSILVAKTVGVVFLLGAMLAGASSLLVGLSALVDIGMAVSVLAVHRRVGRPAQSA